MKQYLYLTPEGHVRSAVTLQDGDTPSHIDGLTVVASDAVLPQPPDNISHYHLDTESWVDTRHLGEKKGAAWQDIRRMRDSASDSPLITPFGVFDADARGQAGIDRATRLAEQLNTPVDFTLHDNQVVSLGAAELAQVSLMLAQRAQTLRAKATALRAQIEAAVSATVLDFIAW